MGRNFEKYYSCSYLVWFQFVSACLLGGACISSINRLLFFLLRRSTVSKIYFENQINSMPRMDDSTRKVLVIRFYVIN